MLNIEFLLKTKQNLSEQNRSTKTYRDRPIQLAHYCYTSQILMHNLGYTAYETNILNTRILESWNYQNSRIGKYTYSLLTATALEYFREIVITSQEKQYRSLQSQIATQL